MAWLAAAADRQDPDGVRAAVPRLLALTLDDDLGPLSTVDALDALRAAGWDRWPRRDQEAVVDVLDAWWLATLVGHPSRPPAADVLAAQARLRGEVRPLLDRWLHELDGAGAVHLAEVVRDHLDPEAGRLIHPGWDGFEDLATQVAAWARSDAVVLGLTVIGGAHLDPGLLSEALDRLI